MIFVFDFFSTKSVWFVGFVVEVYSHSQEFEMDVDVNISKSLVRRRIGKVFAPFFIRIGNENFPF